MNGSLSESLIEALDSIKETKQDVARLTQPGIPIYIQDPDQITDYPRGASPDLVLSRSSLNGSRRSSLSAVSESSLNSEGSFSYDANKRPTRNILKNPHVPRRRSKKNVRWNLPNGGMGFIENDSDTTSLESFDSSSTTSSLFVKARNGVAETRQNWREFERAPSPGSTGITPSKAPFPGSRFNSRPSSAPQASLGSPVTITPDIPYATNYESTHKQALISNPRQTALLGGSPQHRFLRSPSPLSNSAFPNNSHDQGGFNRLSRVVPSTSTPIIRRTLSETNALRSTPMKLFKEQTLLEEDARSASNDIDNPLILKLSDSKVTELEASTLEDRQRMHVFEFPKKSRRYSESARFSQMTSVPLRHPPKSVRTAFLEDDDKSDYDHLSPLSGNTKTDTANGTSIKGRKLIENMVKLRDKKISNRSSIVSYTEDDLDDALREIENDSQGSSDGMSQEATFNEETPPPLPERKTHHYHQQDQRTKENNPTQNKAQPNFSSLEQTNGLGLHRSKSNPVSNRNTNTEQKETTKDTPAPSPLRKPPPVPPKLHRIKLVDRDTNGNPKADSPTDRTRKNMQCATDIDISSSRSSSPQNHTYKELHDSQGEIIVDNILPPPPEFASSFNYYQTSSKNEKSSPKSATSDDPLGSASTSTLIAEADESPVGTIKKTSPITQNSEKQTTVRVYPKSSSSFKKEHPRSGTHSMKITDRIVVGAEDPELASESSPSSQHKLGYEKSSPQDSITYNPIVKMPQQIGISSAQYSQSEDPTHRRHFLASQNATTSNPPLSPRYKISMETAFVEGNLLKNSSFSPPPRSSRQHHVLHTGLDSGIPAQNRRYQMQKIQGRQKSTSAFTPLRPAPPPPQSNKTDQVVSPEDKQVLERFFSADKLPLMKPTVHNTDTAIEELLADLDINNGEIIILFGKFTME